jgi:superfamily I DNA/RNA helicase
MSKLLPKKRVLQIAYNAMLRKEVEAKIRAMEIQNVKVHTFHSLAVCFYMESAHTDSGIRKIVLDNMRPKKTIPEFDIIVLDEAQDMSILYYQFMVKFAFDMGTQFQLFILGDYMQGLYEFKGADIRSLTFAKKVWEKHPLLESAIFHKCTLKMSYRITHTMAKFVNCAMLGDNRLEACKPGEPVIYIRNSRRNLEIVVISQIYALLAAGESAGDIFVLGASVKGVNSNIRKMENALVEKGIPCYVPMFDTERIDEKITEGKVVFSTFHDQAIRQILVDAWG